MEANELVPAPSYSTLQSADEIRLLYLHPRSADEKITFNLKHEKLSDKPQYEALSYTWGSPGGDYMMILDDNVIRTRENLWLALGHLQLANKPRVLWVDAICINQQDTRERNHQVTQMGQIYQEASRVIAWLGPSDKSSAVAIRTIAKTAERFFIEGYEDNTMLNLQIGTSDGVPCSPLAEMDEQLRVCLAIENFCLERNYWSRLWIIQELVLATEIRIQCGDDQLEWSKFAYLLDRMDRDRHRVSVILKPTTEKIRRSIPARLVRQRIDRQRGLRGGWQLDESPLHDLCLRFVEAKCEDRRDKIYGLLGIAAKCCRNAVLVDYSLSAYEICGRVLQHHFLAHVSDKQAPASSRELEHKSTSIIPTSQVFHRALEITPDLVSEYQLQVAQNIVRKISCLHYLRKINSSRQVRPKKSSLPRSFGERIVGSFPLMKLANLSVDTFTSSIEIVGDFMGKIVYLSPSFSEDVQFAFFQAHMPTKVPSDQPFIADELRRITIARTKSRTFCYENRNYVEVQAIPDEVDLVYEVMESQSLIRFTGKSGIVRQAKPALATSEIFPLDFDFSREFYTLWNEAKMAISPNKSRSCRIAIEEHGFICIVPNGTRTGDSICVFRQTDVVAVIRQSGTKKGRVSGRAISFLAHHATTPLRNFKGWPTLAVPEKCQVLCQMDIQTLQMLTLASSNPDPFERRVQRSFAYN